MTSEINMMAGASHDIAKQLSDVRTLEALTVKKSTIPKRTTVFALSKAPRLLDPEQIELGEDLHSVTGHRDADLTDLGPSG